MLRAIVRIALVVICLSAPVGAIPMVKPLVADSIPKHLRHGAVGLKLGVINVGNMHHLDHLYEPNAAACGELFFDIPLISHLMLTTAADVYDIRALSVSKQFIDISLGFKGWTYLPKTRMAIRPGAAIGFGYLGNMDFIRPSTYLTLKGFGEMVLFPEGNYAWVFDIGVFWAPYGQVDREDITISPSLYARFGLSL